MRNKDPMHLLTALRNNMGAGKWDLLHTALMRATQEIALTQFIETDFYEGIKNNDDDSWRLL